VRLSLCCSFVLPVTTPAPHKGMVGMNSMRSEGRPLCACGEPVRSKGRLRDGRQRFDSRCSRCNREHTIPSNAVQPSSGWLWRKRVLRVLGDQCVMCDWDVLCDVCVIAPGSEHEGITSYAVLCPNHRRVLEAGLLDRHEVAARAAGRIARFNEMSSSRGRRAQGRGH
jgi:hypothetical protein